MAEETRPPGTTTIALEVLASVARLAAVQHDSVSHLSPTIQPANRFRRQSYSHDGVSIQVDGKTVNADLYLVLTSNVNIRQVSREIQKEVARAITEMVGMEVGDVNIHIDDIYFDKKD